MGFIIALIVGQIAFAMPEKPSYSFQPPVGWQRQKTLGPVALWLAGDRAHTGVSIYSHQFPRPLSLQKATANDLITLRARSGQVIHSVLGVTDEKIETQVLEPSGTNGYVLKLSGSYVQSPANSRVRFVEWEFFIDDRYYQIKYSQNQTSTPLSMTEVKRILSTFKPNI